MWQKERKCFMLWSGYGDADDIIPDFDARIHMTSFVSLD
jgi:hypothetical protein